MPTVTQKTENKADLFVKNNFESYKTIYNTVLDSVNLFRDSLLNAFLYIYYPEWQIDSMICINSSKDLLATTINRSNGRGKEGTADGISMILGKKIRGNWYIFPGGGNLVVPRDMYGKDSLHPLTFHELSQIARKEMLEGSLIKNEKGEYTINDKWIEERFYNGGFDNFTHHKVDGLVSPGEEYQMPRDKGKTDSVHWHLIMDKWNHKIDTNAYKPRKKNKAITLP